MLCRVGPPRAGAVVLLEVGPPRVGAVGPPRAGAVGPLAPCSLAQRGAIPLQQLQSPLGLCTTTPQTHSTQHDTSTTTLQYQSDVVLLFDIC